MLLGHGHFGHGWTNEVNGIIRFYVIIYSIKGSNKIKKNAFCNGKTVDITIGQLDQSVL